MNIVITGAGSGIGYQTAKLLAQNPVNKVIAISQNPQNLQNLQTESLQTQAIPNIIAIPFNLEQLETIHELTTQIEAHFTHIDVLINNAGTLVNKPFQQITLQDLQHTYNINTLSPYILIQTLLPLLKKSNTPQILNISSMGGITGTAKFAGLSAYSSSKGALVILSECLAEELKPYNITVNCLALGAVSTQMLSKAFPNYTAPTTPQQMAQFIGNFITNSYQFFNGKTIPVSISTP